MEKYYAKRARQKGIVRKCSKCPTVLSRYNSSDKCEGCKAETRRTERVQLLELIGNASI